ncbi:MAG: hypothetical protein JW934_07720 [Anaerolineae bacterium]|nr:hypothetical protein [Anaerolineae bacterium]
MIETQPTPNRSEPSRVRPNWTLTLTLIVLILVALIACVWSILALFGQAQRQFAPTVADTAKLQTQADNIRFWAVVGRIGLGVLFAAGVAAGVIIVIGGAVAAVQWLGRKAITIEPRNGLYPLLRDVWLPKWLGWLLPVIPNRVINPNLLATPVIDLSRPTSQFVGAKQVSSAQMQITTQAQVVQAEAAQASGVTNLHTSVSNGRANRRPQQPIVILERELPPVRYAPGSQIAEVIEQRDRELDENRRVE